MKLAWLTDPHLNFAGITKAQSLAQQVVKWDADALCITGDIGESHDLQGWLELIVSIIQRPVYFVLGNHDFYHATIAEVRATASALTSRYANLHWMGAEDVISLTEHTALIGHDGWGDGREGDMHNSPVMLNDFVCIEDLKACQDLFALEEVLGRLGDEAAEYLEPRLRAALKTHRHVYILTHIPPFRESAWYEGSISDDNWSPYFVCQAVGRMLSRVMGEHPDRRATVLCGHTHSGGHLWAAPNLDVRTGAAVYRKPALQEPILVM